MNNFIYKTSPLGELKDADEKSGIVKGYVLFLVILTLMIL